MSRISYVNRTNLFSLLLSIVRQYTPMYSIIKVIPGTKQPNGSSQQNPIVMITVGWVGWVGWVGRYRHRHRHRHRYRWHG